MTDVQIQLMIVLCPKTQYADTMLDNCWTNIYDAGPTLGQCIGLLGVDKSEGGSWNNI